DDADEDVEVNRHHGGDDVDPPPDAGQVQEIEGEDGDRQHRQGYDADALRRRESGVVKEKSGDAGEDQGQQRQRGPARHALALHHGGGDDDAGDDPDQADQ